MNPRPFEFLDTTPTTARVFRFSILKAVEVPTLCEVKLFPTE